MTPEKSKSVPRKSPGMRKTEYLAETTSAVTEASETEHVSSEGSEMNQAPMSDEDDPNPTKTQCEGNDKQPGTKFSFVSLSDDLSCPSSPCDSDSTVITPTESETSTVQVSDEDDEPIPMTTRRNRVAKAVAIQKEDTAKVIKKNTCDDKDKEEKDQETSPRAKSSLKRKLPERLTDDDTDKEQDGEGLEEDSLPRNCKGVSLRLASIAFKRHAAKRLRNGPCGDLAFLNWL